MKISPELDLPIDAATGTFGILATRGAGKSNAAVVMAEEMYDAGVPFVAIDPKGDWWGTRSSADGKSAGLPIIVFGGRHGDVPLEPTAGQLIAALVLEQRLSCILDVSQFTKADTTRFLLAFGRHLFAHADDDGPEPLHLFLEEAHEYLPQVPREQAELVSVWQRIVKQGRFKGLGCTMISQRSSVLNKDVLELVDTLIVLRTIGPLSRKAIGGWVAGQDVDAGLLDSLPTLKDGEAWVWSPGELKIMERIRFRRRRTFDSGATPKVGETRRTPSTIADVDLAAIKEQMADTIERAKADDPKELRKRIKDLERQLGSVEPVVEVREVQVPVVPAAIRAALRSLHERATRHGEAMADLVALVEQVETTPLDRPSGTSRTAALRRPVPTPPATRPARPSPAASATAEDDGAYSLAERRILTILSQRGDCTRTQLATLSNYHQRAKSFTNAIGHLRTLGHIERGEPFRITDTGRAVASTLEYEEIPTGRDLLEYWKAQPKLGKVPGLVLDQLAGIWPDSIDRDALAETIGYHPRAKSFTNALGQLRGLDLITRGTDIRLTDDFGDAIT